MIIKNMKQYNYFTLLLLLALLITGCSNEEAINPVSSKQITALQTEMGEMDINGDVSTRAIPGFAVNTAEDPTFIFNNRTTGWTLNVRVFDQQQGNSLYNESLCTWNGSAWVPDNILYFPNYLRQQVEATLYPTGWTNATPILFDQPDAATLTQQDILMQQGSPRATVLPAHIPSIPMEHMYSMLDFVIHDVDPSQIVEESIKVHVGNDIYTPYRTANTTKMEYLVILPLGVINPKVTLSTVKGLHYVEEIEITEVHPAGTQRNTCYCANLYGIELILSSVTVTDWLYGPALAGQYTTIASNPTFHGPIGGQVTLIYDNGQEQTIFFNRWGEATIRPLGRTITQLRKSDNTVVTLNPPIVLRSMYIDLGPYLN